MEIKKAKKRDFDEVYALWKRADLTIQDEEKERTAYELILQKNPEFCLVARNSGRIIGTVLGSFNGRTGWINHLAVEPEHQGKGLGGELMAELEKRFKREKVTRVRLGIYKPELALFYEKFGFAIIKDIIFMGKELA